VKVSQNANHRQHVGWQKYTFVNPGSNSSEIKLEVEPTTKVEVVLTELFNYTGVKTKLQRLLFDGQQIREGEIPHDGNTRQIRLLGANLDAGHTLSDYKIKEESDLWLVMSQEGG
jgi:hypothetical protein